MRKTASPPHSIPLVDPIRLPRRRFELYSLEKVEQRGSGRRMGGTLTQEDEVTLCVCWMLDTESPKPFPLDSQNTHLYQGRGLKEISLGNLFFFFFLRFIYLLMAELDLGCCAQAFSSCGKRGPISSGGEQASHCGGFPCCRARALGHTGSVVAAHGLIYTVACGPSQTRARIHVPCTGRWILN